MADIHITRSHALGLPRARELARTWVTQAEQRYGMQCSLTSGDAADLIAFKRAGVDGQLRVAADRFELDAKLGFLFAAFSEKIAGEIGRNLDALLAA